MEKIGFTKGCYLSDDLMKYRLTPSTRSLIISAPAFLRIERCPRTVCFCQPVFLQSSSMVVPLSDLRSCSIMAFLVIFGVSSAGFVSVFLSAVCVVMTVPFLVVGDVMNASI